MSIKVEAFKIYIDRTGNVRGPMQRAEVGPYIWEDNYGERFTDDGHYFVNGQKHPSDLIAEFVELPRIELLTAVRVGPSVRISIVADGKTQQFDIKPQTAAAGLGRIAEALAEQD